MLRKFQEEVFVNYRLGIDEMDSQHWSVLQILVNVSECSDMTSAVMQLDRFMSQWKHHLNDEETYMEKLQFPYQSAHKSMHVKLFSEYSELREKMVMDQFGRFALRDYAKTALKKVLDHIDHYDRQYGDWLTSNQAPN